MSFKISSGPSGSKRSHGQDNEDTCGIRIKSPRQIKEELISDEENFSEPPTPPVPTSHSENDEISYAPPQTPSNDHDNNDRNGSSTHEIRDKEKPGFSRNLVARDFFGIDIPVSPPPADAVTRSTEANKSGNEAQQSSNGGKSKRIGSDEEQQYGAETIQPIPMYFQESTEESEIHSGNDGGSGDDRYYLNRSIYKKYDFSSRKEDGTRHVVFKKKEEILGKLKKSRILVIEGFTGCGKTTQVPQYILDDCRDSKKFCKIIVTQPRKLAAISVAKRVCYERCWNIGSIVGYQVGMDSNISKKDTLLTFVTTGVLQQQLIQEKSLKNYSHIIIDEVHERDLDTDFLLLLIRKIMAMDKEGRENHVKLILMSATVDARKFEKYFAFRTPRGDIVPPEVVKIPMTRSFNVDEIYLDQILKSRKQMDMLETIQSHLNKEKASVHGELYGLVAHHITELDPLEKSQIGDPRMRTKPGIHKNRGSVLVFLPGMDEIKAMERVLKEENPRGERQWETLFLHSSLCYEDQNKVFQPTKGSVRKIILSTTIAESSITVPDIVYVYDFCMTKSRRNDTTTNFTSLKLIWTSQSQCVQRKGRAGRVADGKVYRLVSKDFYDTLEKETMPEMKRSNLETIILRIKKCAMESPKKMLSEALDRPDLSSIKRAIITLKELGALTIEMKNEERQNGIRYDEYDGDLTFVGKVMADLPIPEKCTRLILFGLCFGVMHEAIIIAAGLNGKSPFKSGFKDQLEVYMKKMEHARDSFSDLFAIYFVYKTWELRFSMKKDGNALARAWAKDALVHIPVLNEMKKTVEDLEKRIKTLGISGGNELQSDKTLPEELTSEQGLFLKLAIAGAFYPDYFVGKKKQTASDPKEYERKIQRELCGKDPFNTVCLRGFPRENNGELYAKHVAEYLSYGRNVPTVRFEGQNVLATFNYSVGKTIGPFNRAIFRAIKLHQLKSNLEYNILGTDKEEDEKKNWLASISQRKYTVCPPSRNLPAVDEKEVKIGQVCHFSTPSHFWVTFHDDMEKRENMEALIKRELKNCLRLPQTKLCPNSFCLAPYETSKNVKGSYHRAKIIRIANSEALIYFVDYGHFERIDTCKLLDFSPEMIKRGVPKSRCMAVECRLKGIRPNNMYGIRWCDESIQFMETFISRAIHLQFNIFSVHESVLIGDLIGYKNTPEDKASLRDILLIKQTKFNEKVFGEEAAEPTWVMVNHNFRNRSRLLNTHEKKNIAYEQIGEPLNLDFIDPPSEAKIPCLLNGPRSPLEMEIHALVRCTSSKLVKLENSGVNSILLDHQPTTSYSRLLVASHIQINERSKSVMVGESTIMPPVPGLLSLLCLMFAPKADLRVNKDMSMYTGVLCGCGIIPNEEEITPIHANNGMEIIFDTEIDNDDIDQVNQIRKLISEILRNGTNNCHKRLCTAIIKLLQRKRKDADIKQGGGENEQYTWSRRTTLDVDSDNGFSHESLLQPHNQIQLKAIAEEEEEELIWNGGY